MLCVFFMTFFFLLLPLIDKLTENREWIRCLAENKSTYTKYRGMSLTNLLSCLLMATVFVFAYELVWNFSFKNLKKFWELSTYLKRLFFNRFQRSTHSLSKEVTTKIIKRIGEVSVIATHLSKIAMNLLSKILNAMRLPALIRRPIVISPFCLPIQPLWNR